MLRIFGAIAKGIGAPDPGWMPFVKILFGFFILFILAVLAAIIALGQIKAESSFGLDIILGGLLTLSGGFAGWAFRDTHPTKPGEPDVEEASQATEVERHSPSIEPDAG